jgi:hypothetical protein
MICPLVDGYTPIIKGGSKMIAHMRTMQDQPGQCTILLRGRLAPRCADWFGGVTMTHTPGGDTVLQGTLADQEAFNRLVGKILDLNLTMLSLDRVDREEGGFIV